jgi:hypothetical protein
MKRDYRSEVLARNRNIARFPTGPVLPKSSVAAASFVKRLAQVGWFNQYEARFRDEIEGLIAQGGHAGEFDSARPELALPAVWYDVEDDEPNYEEVFAGLTKTAFGLFPATAFESSKGGCCFFLNGRKFKTSWSQEDGISPAFFELIERALATLEPPTVLMGYAESSFICRQQAMDEATTAGVLPDY